MNQGENRMNKFNYCIIANFMNFELLGRPLLLSREAAWLSFAIEIITLIAFIITIYEIRNFWKKFNQQNLSMDARKALDCLDELINGITRLRQIITKGNGEKEYIPYSATLIVPINNLQNILNILMIRTDKNLFNGDWIKNLKEALRAKNLSSENVLNFIEQIDQKWRENDEIDSQEIKKLRNLLTDIYQNPKKYLKK